MVGAEFFLVGPGAGGENPRDCTALHDIKVIIDLTPSSEKDLSVEEEDRKNMALLILDETRILKTRFV